MAGQGRFGNIFKIRPPMVFQRSHADALVASMDQAMNELGR